MQANLKTTLLKLACLTGLVLQVGCMPTDYGKLTESEVEFQDNRKPASEESSTLEASSRLVRLGDRYYVQAIFKNAFGPNYDQGNIVYNSVMRQPSSFGGQCDMYERARNGTTIENRESECFDPNWNTPQVIPSTPLREGWRIKVCEYVLKSNTTSVNYAFNKAGINANTDTMSDAKMQELFKLFYPSKRAPASLSNAFKESEAQFSTKRSMWEAALLSLCVSPDWQIP